MLRLMVACVGVATAMNISKTDCPRACPSFDSPSYGTCGNPSLSCYCEPDCNPRMEGCNAGGVGEKCRFCGDQTNIECGHKFPKITIGYKPWTQKVSEGELLPQPCKFDEYRLVLKNHKLSLVAVTDDKPIQGSPFTKEDLVPFTTANGGVFGGRFDESLKLENGRLGVTVTPPGTSENTWDKDTGVWQFRQSSTGTAQLCMGKFNVAACPAVFEHDQFPHATDNHASCGGGWTMKRFNQVVMLPAEQPSCSVCRQRYGSFSCSTLGGCTVTPDSSVCESDLKGTWCSAPAPPPDCPSACPYTTSTVRTCGNAGIDCYCEPSCNPQMEGCNAGGVGEKCRFCGDGTNIVCPSTANSTAGSSPLIV